MLTVQEVEELDLTESEGEFLTQESAEEKLAPALAPGAKISKVWAWYKHMCLLPAWLHVLYACNKAQRAS